MHYYILPGVLSKRLRLKFHLASCVKNKELQRTIQKQLTATLFNIMGKVITAANKEIHSLTK